MVMIVDKWFPNAGAARQWLDEFARRTLEEADKRSQEEALQPERPLTEYDQLRREQVEALERAHEPLDKEVVNAAGESLAGKQGWREWNKGRNL